MAAITNSGINSNSSYTTEVVVPEERKESSIKSSFLIENEEICYETDEQKTQIIESVAARISSFYGTFLQKDWHMERVKAASHEYKGLTFNYEDRLPSEFPCLEKIKQFIENLKKAIIMELNTIKLNRSVNWVSLSTEYAPADLLSRILTNSGIERFYTPMLLFPTKSVVDIKINIPAKKIEITASF